MFRISLFSCLLISSLLKAQIHQVHLELLNPTESIDDGSCSVKAVEGGTAPFSYKWSNRNTPLTATTSHELREGVTYHLLVTDSEGHSFEKSFKIPVKSIAEKINAVFGTVVHPLEHIFMYDPLNALGLYDNVLRDANGDPSLYPNGDQRTKQMPFIIIWLIIGSIFFTFYTRFINIRGFKHAIDLLRGKYDKPGSKGQINHFQALMTALSATVGLGNIAGVAVAISMGGPGATLWIFLFGFFGMATKFVESTLGVKYRMMNNNGEVFGGPMYYLKMALSKKNKPILGQILAVLFAIFCVLGSFGAGNMFQSNQAFQQISAVFAIFQGTELLFGIVLAILVGLVIIGGIKSIARVTSKVVPLMIVIYVSFALIIVLYNIDQIGVAFGKIFQGAFDPEAAKGGLIGVLIIGIRRAVTSNEAGVGSAAIAHASVKTDNPITEGFVALLGPFIDTVVICTLTALVIIFTGYDSSSLIGAKLTSAAFSSIFPWFQYVLSIAIFLFAFSTLLSWPYYGLKAFNFLFGKSKWVTNLYKVLTLIFIIIGCTSELGAVIDFTDFMMMSMAFPNLIGMYFLAPEILKDLKAYLKAMSNNSV